jgi:hypothetical protein
MKTIKIQPINYGDPIVVGTAEYLSYEYPLGQYWFEDVNNVAFDTGAFVDGDETVIDEATFETFLLNYLNITKD